MTQQDIHPDPTRTSPGENAPEPPAHQWFGSREQSAAPTTGIPVQTPEQSPEQAPAQTGQASPTQAPDAPESNRTFPSYGLGTPDAHQQRTDWYAPRRPAATAATAATRRPARRRRPRRRRSRTVASVR